MTKAASDTADSTSPPQVVIYGGFDDLRPNHFRFFEETAKLGKIHAFMWSDSAIKKISGTPPKFPQEERLYLLDSIRYIHKVIIINDANQDTLPESPGFKPKIWVVDEQNDNHAKKMFCKDNGLKYHVLKNDTLNRFSDYVPDLQKTTTSRKKVIVTGCYDWFHSGHVRFFEEVSELGDLYVSIGSDKTIRELKSEEHPMFLQNQRRFVVQSIKYVKQAFIATGSGWLDAEQEIYKIKPEIYAVNEDGDRPEKREFCQANRIEYVVLKRLPKPGLPHRQSTTLRGF
ncbi:MAG: adenylyltransferase/cytidyltransferase family protein [Sedimentisphaerales bacterium]|jgi:cytidyltransferase-like protein